MRIVSSPLEETPDRAEVAGTGQEGNTPGLRHAGTSGWASLSRPMRSRARSSRLLRSKYILSSHVPRYSASVLWQLSQPNTMPVRYEGTKVSSYYPKVLWSPVNFPRRLVP